MENPFNLEGYAMAVQGSGLGKGPDPVMKDQTSFNARSGAAKHPQTEFKTKWGMKDQTGSGDGLTGAKSGKGPDASSSNPLDPESPAERGKVLRRQPSPLKSSWDMKDANGKGVDNTIGPKVIGEAILGGAHLPAGVAKDGPLPKR
jgi:hypothetical protein